jgi:hypothetical protein
MRQLTEYQKKFILDTFFKPLHYEYPGALNIGEVLLTEGGCVIPDTGTYIFKHSPLNQFNKVSKADSKKFIDCVEYTFDLNGFLDSWNLKRAVSKHYEELESQYQIQKQMKNELFELTGAVVTETNDELRLNQLVYHTDIYWAREQMKIVGLRENEVELEGDYSGGTHDSIGRQWFPIKGVSLIKSGVEGGEFRNSK